MYVISDKMTFERLYGLYAEDVYRFSFWLTGNSDDAKDITSETFVRVWTAGTETRFESVKAYLFTIAKNLWLREQGKRKRLSRIDEEPHDGGRNTEEHFQQRYDLELALKALQMLPEVDRVVLIMRAQDELSYEDIAAATGLTVSSVKVKLFRARKKMQSFIKTEQGERQCK